MSKTGSVCLSFPEPEVYGDDLQRWLQHFHSLGAGPFGSVESLESELALTCTNHKNTAVRSSAGMAAFALILFQAASFKLHVHRPRLIYHVNPRGCEAQAP